MRFSERFPGLVQGRDLRRQRYVALAGRSGCLLIAEEVGAGHGTLQLGQLPLLRCDARLQFGELALPGAFLFLALLVLLALLLAG